VSLSREAQAARAFLLALAAAVLLRPAALRAQGNTDETLHKAVQLYEELQVERALVLLRQVISPSSPFVVSSAQRVEAYKYLGAAHAILGQSDSASVYFRAAIERDPFVDLDAQAFTAVERAAFAQARQRTFAVAVRPITRTRIDPRTERMTFVLLSTHACLLHAEVRDAKGSVTPIFESENDGVREIQWDGLLADGHLAPGGRYEFVVRGQSHITDHTDSARLYLDVVLDHPPLEDTLPALGAADLLPEHYPASASSIELAKGLGIAVTALAIPLAVGDHKLGAGARGLAGVMAAGGIAIGAGGFVWRRQHNEIAANIAENTRRKADRDEKNAEIERRNDQRIAVTALVISPAAGVGP
jgi:tetratricopeptide (TPR) repeat protein